MGRNTLNGTGYSRAELAGDDAGVALSTAETARAGFTLVESLAASLAGAILALTAGIILLFGFRVWRDNSREVDLQRDGTAALQLLARPLREASLTDVTVQPGRLDIATGGSTVAFYGNAVDLIYDPDTGASGDEIVVVDGRLRDFTLTGVSLGVFVVLELEDGDAETRLESFIAYRN